MFFKKLTLSLFISLVFLQSVSANEAPIIHSLKLLLKKQPTIKMQIEHVLSRTRAPLWMGANVKDFVNMFAKWRTFQQTPESVARYFFLFQGFMDSPGGKQVINNPLFASWLHQFMLARGAFLDSPASKSMLKNWINNPAVKIQDYIVPADGFQSFNQFFTRQIKPGKRTFIKETLDSPVDGVAYILQSNLTESESMLIKHDKLNLPMMLGSQKLANKFKHGSAALIFLGAMNYHHFLAPVSGKLIHQQLLGGTYQGQLLPYRELLKHRRAVMIIQSPRFGQVAVIPFGMYSISSIILNKKVGDHISLGDDLGYFQYGGSTVVVLTQKNKADFKAFISSKFNKVVYAGNSLAKQISIKSFRSRHD